MSVPNPSVDPWFAKARPWQAEIAHSSMSRSALSAGCSRAIQASST